MRTKIGIRVRVCFLPVHTVDLAPPGCVAQQRMLFMFTKTEQISSSYPVRHIDNPQSSNSFEYSAWLSDIDSIASSV